MKFQRSILFGIGAALMGGGALAQEGTCPVGYTQTVIYSTITYSTSLTTPTPSPTASVCPVGYTQTVIYSTITYTSSTADETYVTSIDDEKVRSRSSTSTSISSSSSSSSSSVPSTPVVESTSSAPEPTTTIYTSSTITSTVTIGGEVITETAEISATSATISPVNVVGSSVATPAASSAPASSMMTPAAAAQASSSSKKCSARPPQSSSMTTPAAVPEASSAAPEAPSAVPAATSAASSPPAPPMTTPAAVPEVSSSSASSVPSPPASSMTTPVAVPAAPSAASSPPASSMTTPAAEATEAPSSSASSAPSPSASSSSSSSPQTSNIGSDLSGQATFYGGNVAGGACSFSTYTLPSSIYGTALSDSNWDTAANCGACVRVTGPSGNSITAMIVDECPGCGANHLDLFPTAFSTLANPSTGVIDVTWTYTSCPITSPLQLVQKSGVSAYWFSMQVVNANEPVAKLEVSANSGSTWTTATRTTYNFFEISSGTGSTSVDVRVTSQGGDVVTVRGIQISSGAVTDAASNF